MEEKRTKEVLDFLLSAYRARLAIQDKSDNCPFDFTSYLAAWKRTSWDQLHLTMRENLRPLLEEGLFDSILPYLSTSFVDLSLTTPQSPSNALSKYDPYTPRSSILGSIGDLNLRKSREKRKSKEKVKDAGGGSCWSGAHGNGTVEDCEIVIHVCDESKGIREDFYCQQSILTTEMGYFTRVTVKGQRLRDMDISVHCDIAVFDWLMKWVHHRSQQTSNPPQLDPSNVIGLVVSADFLQMTSLVSECLRYTYENLEDVIAISPNLGCLSEQLTSTLARYFFNADIEKRISPIDKNDRITSRLYIQFILSLNDAEPDMTRGHYASTATLFKCDLCEQYLTNDYAPKIPCTSMRFDCRGRIYASHFKNPNWSLAGYIKELKRELKNWRKVYWRLWGTIHFFHCSSCQLYFPAKNLGVCRYHPEPAKQLPVSSSSPSSTLSLSITEKDEKNDRVLNLSTITSTKEQEQQQQQLPLNQSLSCANSNHSGHHHRSMRRTLEDRSIERRRGSPMMKSIHEDSTDSLTYLPYGRYPCCKQLSFYYTPLPHINGCQLRDHTLDTCSEEDPNYSTTMAHRDIIQETSPSIPHLDWDGILQVTTEKPTSITAPLTGPSTSMPMGTVSGAFEDKDKETISIAHRSRYLRELHQQSSSSTDSESDDSEDSEEQGSPRMAAQNRNNRKLNGSLLDNSGKVWESWIWNNDLTTRYNQDMQREREEKLMMDLACLLSQRVPLDPSVGFHAAKYGFLSRRILKENVGGSYVKIDQTWREQHQLEKTKGEQNKNKSLRSTRPE